MIVGLQFGATVASMPVKTPVRRPRGPSRAKWRPTTGGVPRPEDELAGGGISLFESHVLAPAEAFPLSSPCCAWSLGGLEQVEQLEESGGRETKDEGFLRR